MPMRLWTQVHGRSRLANNRKQADMDGILSAVKDLWNLPIYSSGGHQVRLHQLVLALIIFFAGMSLSKRVCAVLVSHLRLRFKLPASTAQVVQRALFYLLMVVVALVALPMAGIPITIFTVLGGALAIGIGFGAQTLFNNLISGVILLIEHPIRVGDIVELDSEIGRVEEIGNRCVRMRRSDGADLLVPNSRFLEERVVNWTLFDGDIRGRITVGVAYGSPADRVRDLMARAAENNPQVHKKPEPLVLFSDFGDNALMFDLYFWCRVQRPVDLRIIESDLRFQIDKLFSEAGIVIAFPQRDVHLDTSRPLEIAWPANGVVAEGKGS